MIAALGKTGARLAVLAAVAYLVFLVATLPAAWFGYALERASGGAIGLGDPGGTVWKGRGALVARSGGGFRRIADIEWRCNPLTIFAGRLGVALSGAAPGASLRASVSFGWSSVRLQNVEASLPASLVESAVPASALFKPEGQVRAVADSLELGPAAVRGAATLEWAGAGVSGVSRLGDYRLQINGSGERAALQLATLRGDLRLNGQGEWRASQPHEVQLQGMAEASADRKDLEPIMVLVAGEGQGTTRRFGWMITI
jgi:general secretion pathway protein N